MAGLLYPFVGKATPKLMLMPLYPRPVHTLQTFLSSLEDMEREFPNLEL